MSTTNSTRITGLGTKDDTLHVAARTDDVLFDLFGEGVANGSHDISIEKAEEIAAALTSAVDEVKANREAKRVKANRYETARRYVKDQLHLAICGKVPGYPEVDLWSTHEAAATRVLDLMSIYPDA